MTSRRPSKKPHRHYFVSRGFAFINHLPRPAAISRPVAQRGVARAFLIRRGWETQFNASKVVPNNFQSDTRRFSYYGQGSRRPMLFR
jgi:hypothetical protein